MKTPLILCVFLVFVSCYSDLDIMQDYPTIPVVYAAINPYDSVHYVRVQKTFSIYTKEDILALSSDSLQFEYVDVSLIGKADDSIKWVKKFSKATGLRDSGFFPVEGFEYYKLESFLPMKLDHNFNPDIDSLILKVKIHDLDIVTKAIVPIMKPGYLNPNPRGTLIRFYHEYSSKFSLPVGGKSECANSMENCYQQIEISVHFKEYYEDSFAIKKVSWFSGSGWNQGWYRLTPTRLFNNMKALLPNDDIILARTLDSIDVAIYRPNRIFSEYWFVREYWENSDRPPFSNFDNSYGLFFTYKIGKQTGFRLERRTLDSLCNGYYYKEMKFKPW